MVFQLQGNPSQHGIAGDLTSMFVTEQPRCSSRKWYLSRVEIEEHSPSRKDGIDLNMEAHLRKLYCSFLKDIGRTLKVPQMTIAIAMMFCHRFYLRQSHAKNDWPLKVSCDMQSALKAHDDKLKAQDDKMKAQDDKMTEMLRMLENIYRARGLDSLEAGHSSLGDSCSPLS